MSRLFLFSSLAVLLSSTAGCSSRSERGPIAAPDRGRAVSAVNNGGADQGRCDFKGRVDREVVETSGPGSLLPNVRRVFQLTSFGDERRRTLVCREVDTNLDGVKDVIRTFNDKGDPQKEEADSNYDGKIDTWLFFTSGRLSREERDTNFDGKPDVWKHYVIDEDLTKKERDPNAPLRLQRIQRDLNFDDKPDVWEFYERGRLERMGLDLDFDGHVDRWDHDEVARRAQDAKERAAEQAAKTEKKDEPKEK